MLTLPCFLPRSQDKEGIVVPNEKGLIIMRTKRMVKTHWHFKDLTVGLSKAQIELVMFVEMVQRPKWVDAMKNKMI